MRLSTVIAFTSFVATLSLAAPVPSTGHAATIYNQKLMHNSTAFRTNGNVLASKHGQAHAEEGMLADLTTQEREHEGSISTTEEPSSSAVTSDSTHRLVRRTENDHLRSEIHEHRESLHSLREAHPGLKDTFDQSNRDASRAYGAYSRAARNGQLTQAHIDNRQNTADAKRIAQGRLTENEHLQNYHGHMINGHRETIKANNKSAEMEDPYADGPRLGQEIQEHSENAAHAYHNADKSLLLAQHSRSKQV
ncbi:hypothetical protein FRC17_002545 [Serendipita sp. 399]|nr:hypothetical protein FRC17_002545 [Serendipita sp. 399]